MPNEAAGDCQLNLAGIRAEVRGQGRQRGPVHVGADTSAGLFRVGLLHIECPPDFRVSIRPVWLPLRIASRTDNAAAESGTL